jgi:hypothetical protein
MLAARPQKITFGEMCDEMGVRGVLVYCADHQARRGSDFNWNVEGPIGGMGY